jgi:hypothetical protein
MGQDVNHCRGFLWNIANGIQGQYNYISINRKQACAHAKFSVSKIRARIPPMDVNTEKGNRIKFRYPKEQHCKGARKENVSYIWGSEILCA